MSDSRWLVAGIALLNSLDAFFQLQHIILVVDLCVNPDTKKLVPRVFLNMSAARVCQFRTQFLLALLVYLLCTSGINRQLQGHVWCLLSIIILQLLTVHMPGS